MPLAVRNGINGYLDKDLRRAVAEALRVDRQSCRHYANQHNCPSISVQFARDLVDRDRTHLLAATAFANCSA